MVKITTQGRLLRAGKELNTMATQKWIPQNGYESYLTGFKP